MAASPEEIAIYDWLLSLAPRIAEPAVVQMGARCIVGRWVPLGENRNGFILESQKRGVEVLGWGASWEEARTRAETRLGVGTFATNSSASGSPSDGLGPTSSTAPAFTAGPEIESRPAFVCAEATPRIPS
jgi:hypothetical protein